MNDTPQAGGFDALLDLIEMARQELGAALAAPQPGAELRQLCTDHLETLIWASSQAGLDDLYLVAEAVLTVVAADAADFDAGRGAEFLDWFTNAASYLQAPAQPGGIEALLNPLPEDSRTALAAIIDTGAGDESAVVDWGDEPGATEIAPPGAAAADDAVEGAEIDTDSILGMLAFELREVSPSLVELARTLVTAPDEAQSATAVEAYREILGRVASVAAELELHGLTLVCRFVEDNLDRVARLPAAERAVSLQAFERWPRVVIEHLIYPQDDARCIAVIDCLEQESWPQPLPYRDQRELIDGLTRAAEALDAGEEELRALEATADQVSLELSADASPELIEAFFDESPGHAESLSALVAAIGNGEDIESNVEAAQRIAHTLKGSGNLVGVSGIANLAHHVEDIFDYIARQRITPPPALANTLQEAADTLESMIEALQGLAPPPADALRVLQDVLDWANRIDSGKMRGSDYTEPERAPRRAEADAAMEAETALTQDFEERRSQDSGDAAVTMAESVRVPLKLLDNIFRIVSETAITAGQIQERLQRLESNGKLIRHNDSSMQQLRYELESLVSIRAMASRHRGSALDGSGDFDPLEMDEYDEFYGATHAYIESVADSREILRDFSGEVIELDALFLEQQRLNKELQQMVLATRMVPVNNISSRLQRTLRQVCRATGKSAELSILGQDLMLDGEVLNRLADPLMHMLRNAVDHGIESAEVRGDAGKPPQGRVELRFQQEGNNVVVRCDDDGAGLDYDKIRQTAIERGLLGPGDSPDNPELAGMILQSGFSTREQITHVSGRGVGMDVVHNTIQALGGTMDIGDAANGGTRISLRLPITLLTSHCLLVAVGELRYAIPTISLTQILSPGVGSIGRLNGKLTFQLEQEVYPAFTLDALVGAAEQGEDQDLENRDVLLVQTAEGVSAVCVERVITSYDLVVKNMGAYVKSISGIAGVSMLGNGEVVPVLDLAAMLQAQGTRFPLSQPAAPAAAAQEEAALIKVLIVDDSLSVRNSLSQLMQDSGYQAMLARDGREAVILLESERPDVVLTDLEMPRMNGLELVSYIRNASRLRELPVVMITSRNMSKHREQAQRVGVNRFIPKPFTDDDVLEAIDEQLAAPA